MNLDKRMKGDRWKCTIVKKEAEKEYGQLSDFYKNDLKSKIWEAGTIGRFGPTFFSFDKKIYQFWEDFPYNLTDEEIYIFTKEDSTMAALPLWKAINKRMEAIRKRHPLILAMAVMTITATAMSIAKDVHCVHSAHGQIMGEHFR